MWAGIGGGGHLEAILQIVGWVIVGHLIAGMWAGYALLADRSKREFMPESGAASVHAGVVRVRSSNRVEIERARELLEAAGAIDVDVVAQRHSLEVN